MRGSFKLCFNGFLHRRRSASPLAPSPFAAKQRHHWSAYARPSPPPPPPPLYQSRSHFGSASSSPSSSSKSGFVSWYLGMIEARPILTKSLTAGAIFTTADVSSQMLTLESSSSLDLVRTLRMAVYGMLLSGPSLHLWFNTVSRVVPKRDIISTLKKMLLGQTVYGPIMTVLFFSYNASLQGETSAEIVSRLKRDLIPTFKSGIVYWPFCDFITFRFIPVRLQPLISNSFSFIWTIYITYMASLAKVEKDATITD